MRMNGLTERERWGRRIGFVGAIAVAFGLMVLVPAAASATSALTLKSPYTGTVGAYEQADLTGCGGSAT
jgi:hypothetical protein